MLSREAPVQVSASLLVEDLRLAFGDLVPALDEAITHLDELDAYLLVAGGSQVIRDHLEDDPAHLLRAAHVASGTRPSLVARVVPPGVTAASRALGAVGRHRPGRRDLAAVAERLDDALAAMAHGVLDGSFDVASADTARGALLEAGQMSSALMGSSLRLPSCFQSFDQHPRDVVVLASQFLARHPGRDHSLVVVGVRTSGSYLAPLLAAALGEQSGAPIRAVTVRPGRVVSSHARVLLEEVASRAGTVVVIDDPPGTGSSLARVAEQLEALGISERSIVLALATLRGAELPAALTGFDAVLLDWPSWDIHRRLAPESVCAQLTANLGPSPQVVAIEPFVLPSAGFERRHAQAGYRVTTRSGDQEDVNLIVAEGSGLGFFGRHGVALSRALPGLVPDILSFADGVQLRRWLPDESRVVLDSADRVRSAVHYVAYRSRALPAKRDASNEMAGQQPAWEVAARILASPFGPLGLVLRAAGIDAAVRSMLAPRRPSVIDGQTGGRSWFDDDGSIVKVSYADRAYSNLDLACYDAAYDVAGLALGTTSNELAVTARSAFLETTGLQVDDERWLLYRLVHLWDRRRLGQLDQDGAELAMSRVWQDWVAARFLTSAPGARDGLVWAIDVDGVLETSRFGAPVLTTSAALALGALRAHGHRALLATGRSLTEVRDRCERYGLEAGVAEYGCVVFNASSGSVTSLVDDDSIAALLAARRYLSSLDGVFLSDNYAIALRAFRVADRRRVPLRPEETEAVLRAAQGQLVAHRGVAQVDFVPAGTDKSLGVAAMLKLLGTPSTAPDVAVGDSHPDIAMLSAAGRAFVPAHGAGIAAINAVTTTRSFQRGFAQAVTEVLGHSPGSCSICALPTPLPGRARLIASLLAGTEGGRRRGVEEVPSILRASWEVARQPECS